MSHIRFAELEPIYDSRGRPTVEATITLDTGAMGRAGAPSGASTGAHEVSAFPAGGVPEALATFRSEVAPALVGQDASQLAVVDSRLHEIDGTPNFARIGGNTATAVSVASALAWGRETDRPLWKVLARSDDRAVRFPAIVGNCLNGGVHAIGGPDIQEFIAFAEEPKPDDAIRAAIQVHARLGQELRRRFPQAALGRGDEGGWVAPLSNVEAIALLSEVCTAVRDETHLSVHPGLDLAASEFFRDGRYHYKEQTLDPEGQVGFVAKMVDRYGLRYVEDPFDEEAFDSFAALTAQVGDRAVIVGDDLYVTQADRLARGIERHSSNAVLIKVNQVGTLSDTLRTVDLAGQHGLKTITSHRSGEVPDAWLSHVAVGTRAHGLKCGVLGGERVAKLNELLRLGRATGR